MSQAAAGAQRLHIRMAALSSESLTFTAKRIQWTMNAVLGSRRPIEAIDSPSSALQKHSMLVLHPSDQYPIRQALLLLLLFSKLSER